MWNIKNTMLFGSVVQAGSDQGADWFVPGANNPIFGPADMVEVRAEDVKVSITITGGRVSVELVDRVTDLRILGIITEGHNVKSIEFGEN
jgi:hypothetical protein